MSIETRGSSVYSNMFLSSFSEAFLNAELISDILGLSPSMINVKSVIEPLGIGILKALPSILPFNSENLNKCFCCSS